MYKTTGEEWPRKASPATDLYKTWRDLYMNFFGGIFFSFFFFSCETPPTPSFDFHMLWGWCLCVWFMGIMVYTNAMIISSYNHRVRILYVPQRERERGLQIMRRWWARKTTRKLIYTFSVFTSVRLFFSRFLFLFIFVCVYKVSSLFDTFGDDERWLLVVECVCFPTHIS